MKTVRPWPHLQATQANLSVIFFDDFFGISEAYTLILVAEVRGRFWPS